MNKLELIQALKDANRLAEVKPKLTYSFCVKPDMRLDKGSELVK